VVAPRFNGLPLSFLLCAALMLPACSSRTGQPVAADTTQGHAPFSVSQIELPYRACSKPQRVGSSIYTAVSRGVDKGGSIVRYDMDTEKIETVVTAPDPKPVGWFVVNDEWLVYSIDDTLYARERIGGEVRVLSRRRDLYAPALNGDLVAWDDLTDDRTHQIVLHDLRSRTSTIVAPVELADLYNNFVAWDGSRLVWTDVRGSTGVYRSYDASSGATVDHILDAGRFRYPGYAQPTAARIYSINFASTDPWDWGVQKVGYYSVAEQSFVAIVDDGFVANSLDVAGGLVAIVDSSQQLTVREADAPLGRVYKPIEGTVDFVQPSADGALIASREAFEGKNRCRLFIIEPR